MLCRGRMERRQDELVGDAMKFIDFFAGIGGIRLGLERAGHECIGFCEFDKFARQSYKAIHNTQNEWEAHDVRTVNSTDVPKADLWCFGFPCQDLSVAGKQKGLQAGERSGLFYEIMRLLAGLQKENRPKWLLVENVKNLLSIGNGFDFLRLLVEMGGLGYNVEWQLLNSKYFGVPQNRERVFIIGRLGEGSGREVFPIQGADGENSCTSEEQRPIRLGNIYGEDKGTGYAGNVWDKHSIAPTLTTMAGGNSEPMILDKEPKVIDAIYNNREPRVTDIAPTLRADRQGLCVGGDIKLIGNYMPSGHNAGNVYDPQGITPTVMDNHGLASAVAIDLTENNPKVTDVARCLQSRYNKGYSTRSGECSGVLVKPVLTPDREEKRQNGRRMKEAGEPMFTLTAQDRHGVLVREATKQGYAEAVEGDSVNLAQPSSETRRGRVGKQIANTLTCSDTMGVVSNTRIRKLTPRECWRLQGFPDDYFDRAVDAGVSNSQLYKQAGNAVTVNVAEAIGKRLREIELMERANT